LLDEDFLTVMVDSPVLGHLQMVPWGGLMRYVAALVWLFARHPPHGPRRGMRARNLAEQATVILMGQTPRSSGSGSAASGTLARQ